MPTIWHYLFSLTAYASLVMVALFALSHLSEGLMKVLRELAVVALFILAYWLLESWATHLADYYYYPDTFWDMVPYFDWGQFSWVPTPVSDPCCEVVISDSAGISLGVPVMEASLTYAMMWTARLLAPQKQYMWPFLTGIAMLALDAFLDPAIAVTNQCAEGSQMCAGVGFWEWFVHEDLGLWYFCIPLFNWVAWYAAPIALVAFVILFRWAHDFYLYVQDRTPAPSMTLMLLDGIMRAILAFALLVLFALAPAGGIGGILIQGLIMLVLVVGTIVSIIYYAYTGAFLHTASFRWQLVMPQFIFYAFALLTLLLSGTLAVFPLILIGILCMVLGGWYAISPYWKP